MLKFPTEVEYDIWPDCVFLQKCGKLQRWNLSNGSSKIENHVITGLICTFRCSINTFKIKSLTAGPILFGTQSLEASSCKIEERFAERPMSHVTVCTMEFRSSTGIRMGYNDTAQLASLTSGATSFKVYIKDSMMNSKHAGSLTYQTSDLIWNSKNNTITLQSGEHAGHYVAIDLDGKLFLTDKESHFCRFQVVKHKDFVRARYFGKDVTCANMPIGQKEQLFTRELNEGEELRVTLDMHGHTNGTAKLMLKRRLARFQEDANEFGNVYSINVISPGKAIPSAVREVLEALQVHYVQRGDSFIVRLQPADSTSVNAAELQEDVIVEEKENVTRRSGFGNMFGFLG